MARTRFLPFLLTVACYLLPFMTVSCPGGASRTVNGLQLAIGTTVEQPQMFGPPTAKHIDGEAAALIALACAAVGVAAALSGAPGTRGVLVTLAVVGAVALLAVQSRVGSQVQQQTMGMVSVRYEFGYWLALTGYVVALITALGPRQAPAKLPPIPAVDLPAR